MRKSVRYEFRINGIVQGVGFRPFIYNLAKSLSLCGWVNNYGSSVIIDVEGEKANLDIFLDRIKKEAPPLSRIKDINKHEKVLLGYTDFEIRESKKSDENKIYISPDVSICEDCKREFFDKDDRRYLYPFINCTNCGPRFTIIKELPYDRRNSTMTEFQMCSKCASEYGDPADRRYHAQPVSCYHCGPEMILTDNKGQRIEMDKADYGAESKTHFILRYVKELLSSGRIIAVKGLGGYHLVCNAQNESAVKELRRRKARDDKPFAVMVRNYAAALKYCLINEKEKLLLESEKKPIVLLKKRKNLDLPDDIAPGNPYLGIMLPYTPVHLLLFHTDTSSDLLSASNHSLPLPEALIMTSGNRSSEPICYKDAEAVENLGDIADFFLMNNREIHLRTDDSVTRVFEDNEYMVRRSRGYVPFPITCKALSCSSLSQMPSLLACGGELKNTFCMNREQEFYLSHHIGDLENAETLLSFEQGIEHFRKMFNIEFDAVACDLHPEYLSTKYAMSLDIRNKITVQHHHAHIASCMAENNLNEAVIGVAFDGTGYGEDGHIWGGEFFSGDYRCFKREGHLNYIRMPGGEKAVKEPWRMAISYLLSMGEIPGDGFMSEMGMNLKGVKYFNDIAGHQVAGVLQMLDKNINSPLTSSMGRLFDAVSSLTGIRNRINYEGQAAIELEYIAEKSFCGEYPFTMGNNCGSFVILLNDMLSGIIRDRERNVDISIIASKFHETVANIVLESCRHIREKTGLDKVVLSGGVFQNVTLLERCVKKLQQTAFKVFVHSKVPANDGGISIGQASIAIAKLLTCSII